MRPAAERPLLLASHLVPASVSGFHKFVLLCFLSWHLTLSRSVEGEPPSLATGAERAGLYFCLVMAEMRDSAGTGGFSKRGLFSRLAWAGSYQPGMVRNAMLSRFASLVAKIAKVSFTSSRRQITRGRSDKHSSVR
jgi:hypothetical protein